MWENLSLDRRSAMSLVKNHTWYNKPKSTCENFIMKLTLHIHPHPPEKLKIKSIFPS
jgi:hypothetical protein